MNYTVVVKYCMTLAITFCSSFLGCPYRFFDISCLFDTVDIDVI